MLLCLSHVVPWYIFLIQVSIAPASEQAGKARVTRAAPSPGEICVVSPRDRFHWSHKSSQQQWQPLHTVLTVPDYFTKFTLCFGISSIIFHFMGLPTVVTTDEGKKFHNRVNDELMGVFGIEHRMTTAHHPQTLQPQLPKTTPAPQPHLPSLPSAPTTHLVNQTAASLATQKSSIQLKYVDATMQCGSRDCSLFAIVFAAALANGDQPGGLQFTQSNMQKHLL